jgi:hypothetical protein
VLIGLRTKEVYYILHLGAPLYGSSPLLAALNRGRFLLIMGIPLPVYYMDSRLYNQYNSNAQPNSSTSGPHSQGSKGPCYPPPGYPSFPAHGPSQSGPPPPNDGAGRYYPPPGYPAFPAPNHGGPMPPHPSNSGILPLIQYVNKFLLVMSDLH